ncbi:MAG: hypothetical protein RIQ96_1240 [Pseudomonadota bacterium]
MVTALLASAALLAGCASVGGPAPHAWLLIGEQHDASEHQRIQAETVSTLAREGRLAALALEMAEAGNDTRGLSAEAPEAAVRERLRWSDAGWPWAAYGPVVMAAVRAGVPVFGANLPRAQMRAAMADAALDGTLDASALNAQRTAVRDGHCGMLPEPQIAPMTRIQIARDRQMARTLQSLRPPTAALPGIVVLVAGGGHVLRDIGVPRHLGVAAASLKVLWLQAGNAPPPASLQPADEVRRTAALPPRDYCAELREQFRPRGKE